MRGGEDEFERTFDGGDGPHDFKIIQIMSVRVVVSNPSEVVRHYAHTIGEMNGCMVRKAKRGGRHVRCLGAKVEKRRGVRANAAFAPNLKRRKLR